MTFTGWHPIWDTLNLALILALGGGFLWMLLTWPRELWRRWRDRQAPSFHDRMMHNAALAERKVQNQTLMDMEQRGTPVWRPEKRRQTPEASDCPPDA
jgi:hypothetical protein